MADSNRTLDDILAEARSEPPVLSRDEAEQLLAHHPKSAGATLPRIHWQRYIMMGMIIAAAAIVAVTLGTPGSDEANRTAARDARGESTSIRATTEPRQSASMADISTGDVSTAGALDSARTVVAPTTRGAGEKPTPGEKSLSWGYRFAKGQVLEYRLVTEVSDAAINNNYTQIRVVSVYVESVDAEGRAAVTITRLAETIDRRGTVEVPDFVIVKEARQPKVIHVSIGHDGRAIVERVEHDDDAISTMNVGGFVEQLFAPLPDASITVRRQLKDSSTTSHSIPSVDSNQSISMVDVRDTVHRTYSLIGPRDIGGTVCTILVATRTQAAAIDNAARSVVTTTIDEIYLRKTDGLPIRATSTSTRHSYGGAGSTHRTSLELIGEQRPTDSGAAATDERID